MHSRIYRFDRYRLDPTRHEFWDGDEEITLQLKVFECLVYLIEHRDRAVCRDELISAVWGKIDVNDHTLTEIIRRSRAAVGDSGTRQAVIRTVSGFGYGWVLPVEELYSELTLEQVDGSASSSPDLRPHAHHDGRDGERGMAAPGVPTRKSWSWMRPAFGIAGLLAVTASIALFSQNNGLEPDSQMGEQVALVLPLSVPNESDATWMRLGLMELVADRLRQSGQTVIPSDNVVALVGNMEAGNNPLGTRIEDWMTAANANWAVHGEVQRLDEHWYVSLRLIGNGSEPEFVANGQGQDVFDAVHAAVDHLTTSVGHVPVELASDNGQVAVNRVLGRAEAANLAGRRDAAIAIIDQAGDEYSRLPKVRFRKAIILLDAGRFAQSRELLTSLEQSIESGRDPLMHGQVQYGLGMVAQRSLDYRAAEPRYDEAITSLGSLENHEARRTLGRALSARATIRGTRGEFVGAREDQARARMAFESTGDQLSIGRLEGNLAILLMNQGRYADALPHARNSLKTIRLFGDVASEQRLRLILSTAASAQLDVSTADTEAERLTDLIEQYGSPNLDQCANIRRMETLFDRGRLAAADELLQSILEAQALPNSEVSGRAGNPPEAAAARKLMELGRADEAIEFAEAVLNETPYKVAPPIAANLWLTLFRARLAQGDRAVATQVFDDARSWARSQGYSLDAQDMALLEAEHAVAFGYADVAREHFELALTKAQDRGIPTAVYRAASPYANWLIEQGDLSRASVVAGHVAPWAESHFGAALLQIQLYHAAGDVTAWHRALKRAEALAGERPIPDRLQQMPEPAGLPGKALPSDSEGSLVIAERDA